MLKVIATEECKCNESSNARRSSKRFYIQYKKLKISIHKKFDVTRSKFQDFEQQAKFFLHQHLFLYSNDTTQVKFVNTIIFDVALSWFVPLMKKNSKLLHDLDAFMKSMLFHLCLKIVIGKM